MRGRKPPNFLFGRWMGVISENTQILDNNVASDWTKKALVDRLEENREEITNE